MAYKSDETGGGNGGTGNTGSLETAAALLAAVIDEVGSQDGICYVATVTDTSWRLSDGYINATIGGSEVHVIDWTLPVSEGSKLIVKKFDNSSTSPYVILNYAEADVENTVEYCADFQVGESLTRRFYAKWGGVVRQIVADGATFALTVGGASVGVGDTVSAGTWVTVTASADGSGIAVMIG